MAEYDHATKMLDQWLASGEITGSADELLIKRAFPRLPIAEDFVIRAIEPPGDSEFFVKGYNISPNGLGVTSKNKIESETKVQVQSDTDSAEDSWLSATIVHCTLTVNGYKIGLRFDHAIEMAPADAK